MAMRTDRIELKYTLAFQTPFHFGTGIREGLIDRTIARDSQGYLYVPGSTFKGILRERCEQLARLYEELDAGMYALIADPHNEKIALSGLGQKISMITRIFGSQNHAGQLFFDDAYQSNEDKRQYDSQNPSGKEEKGRYKNLQVDLYTQVRLNRQTRTAVRGALYTSEFGLRDLTFSGAVTGWLECTSIDEANADLPTYSLLLLLAGLTLVDRLGGNKSTGKGQCSCDITGIKVDNHVYSPEQWQSWLEHLDALSYYSTYASTYTMTEEEEA